MKNNKKAKSLNTEKKPVKIRQPLVENPAYDFEYEKNPPKNPEGKFMSFEEANEKYKIEGGQLEYFVTKAFVLDGDVHIKSDEEVQKIVAQAHKDEHSVLILITGNLTFSGCLDSGFQPLMVCGDLRCNEVFTDDFDATIKGNIYAKHAFIHRGSSYCFACLGKVFTPYFLTNNDDVNLNVKFAKDTIAIYSDPEMYYGSEAGHQCHYYGKKIAKVMEYEVLNFGFEFDKKRFISYVADGKNPIREFKRSKQEVIRDKKQKANDVVAGKIKQSSTTLDLSRMNLTSLPEDVCQLTHLEELNLQGNKIKKLPNEIKSLTKLKRLNLSNNSNININAICELENLEFLNIDSCALLWETDDAFELPRDFGRLKNLKTLLADVGNAHFANPQVIADLENLEKLEIPYYYLFGNSKKRTLEIKKMKNLKNLRLSGGRGLSKLEKQKIRDDHSHCKNIIFGQ